MTPLQIAAETAYVARQKRLADRADAYLAAEWDRLDSRDSKDVAKFEKSAGPVMAAFQAQSVALSAAFLTLTTGTSLPSPDVVTPVAWRDPFIAYWRKLKVEGDLDGAVEAGRLRAGKTAHTAVVRASDDFVRGSARKQVVGYRRRTRGESCDWCTRQAGDYAKDDIDAWRRHKKCDCIITPIEK